MKMALYAASKLRNICRYFTNNRLLSVRHCGTSYRAILYVPGNDVKKLRKSLNLEVDCIAMDCEDGVAQNKKIEARETITNELNREEYADCGSEIAVRVNSINSGLGCDDISSVLSSKTLPGTILLPKVESTGEIHTFTEEVWKAVLKRPENDRGPVKLVMLIETAKAVMVLPDLCLKAEQLSAMSPIFPTGLILGGDDLVADIGAFRTKSSLEILYARQRLVLTAKAFNLQAIDVVHINYHDLASLKKESEEGAIMGYNGKQVIHPSQIPIVQAAFVPSVSNLEWARALVAAYEENQRFGRGAFVFRGAMIDMPTVRQAQNIIDLARRL